MENQYALDHLWGARNADAEDWLDGTCEFCDRTFADRDQADNHMETVHCPLRGGIIAVS